MALAEVVEIAGDSNVLPAVLDDLVDLSLFPPLERLHPVGDLAFTEGRRDDTVELGPEAKTFLEVEHDVEGWELVEVFVGVGTEYVVVETSDVVSDNQVGLEKERHELGHRVLSDHQELIPIVTIGDSDRNPEAVELAAAAYLGEGSLSLEIEDNDLSTHRHLALGVCVEQIHLTVPVLQGFLQCPSVRGECSTARPPTHPPGYQIPDTRYRMRTEENFFSGWVGGSGIWHPVSEIIRARIRARVEAVYSPAMKTAVEPESLGPPVELAVFSGPLDLLLHLIRKNELSIYDIPIVSICDQYHAYLREMQELDLDIAGDFLWMASWLLHLKSKLLLPRAVEGEEDPREELVERLLAYRRVKELASYLHDTDIVRRCLWTAEVEAAVDSSAEPEIDWEDVDLRLLAQTYLDVMQRFESSHPPPLQVPPLRYRVEDKMRDVYHRVTTDGMVPLLRHLNSRSDREEVVAVIVATLELVRLRGVFAEQRRAFAEIYLRPGDRQLSSKELLNHGESSG